MFHSTGMPFGLLIPIQPWNIVMSSRPTIVAAWLPAPRTSTVGIEYSTAVPQCAMTVAKRDGRRSSGKRVKSRFFSTLGKNGPLFIMNMTTDGKWRLSFDVAAQNQMKHQVSFAPAIQIASDGASAMQDEHDEIMLGATDEEEHLVEDGHRRIRKTIGTRDPARDV
jgi:hypothetical protein